MFDYCHLNKILYNAVMHSGFKRNKTFVVDFGFLGPKGPLWYGHFQGDPHLPYSSRCCTHLWTCRSLLSWQAGSLPPGSCVWPGLCARNAVRPDTPCLLLSAGQCAASEAELTPPSNYAVHLPSALHLVHEPCKREYENSMCMAELNWRSESGQHTTTFCLDFTDQMNNFFIEINHASFFKKNNEL